MWLPIALTLLMFSDVTGLTSSSLPLYQIPLLVYKPNHLRVYSPIIHLSKSLPPQSCLMRPSPPATLPPTNRFQIPPF